MLYIDGENLTIAAVYDVAAKGRKAVIAPAAYEKIERSRRYVESILDDGMPHYGINTGFGAFESVRISKEDLQQLQLNLIRSHSAGVGEALPKEVVRAMMILRANALCRGHSGVRKSVIDAIADMLNAGVHPLVPSRGSVGASGDLAPLAHIALALIGEGKVEMNGEVMDSAEALEKAGITPVVLMEKEGLALINGTQLMTGIGAIAVHEAERMIKVLDAVAGLSLEVLTGTDSAFRREIHEARPHKGQVDTAANMRAILKDSEIIASHKGCPKVQDPYSLRCIPAVHGAAKEGLAFARRVIETEMNSSVDNPLIFPEADVVISGGNFHGAPVALVLETMAVSLSFVANISERRTEKMINRHYSGLPAFLARNGGLNSGLMIAQYTSAALASENKVLCHPACCDTIPTSAGQEDHVSMGSISGLKLLRILENTWRVVAIEALCACEAMEHRKPMKNGLGTGIVYSLIREKVPPLNEDRPLYNDIASALETVRHAGFISSIEEEVGTLRI